MLIKVTRPRSDIVGVMKRTATTIIEVLAILFVVGLAAVVAIPEQDIEESKLQQKALISALEQVRTAIDRYWGEHGAAYPSYDELSALEVTTKVARGEGSLGNYLNRLPDNPYCENNVVGDSDTPIGETAWIYDASTGTFKANDSVDHRKL